MEVLATVEPGVERAESSVLVREGDTVDRRVLPMFGIVGIVGLMDDCPLLATGWVGVVG